MLCEPFERKPDLEGGRRDSTSADSNAWPRRALTMHTSDPTKRRPRSFTTSPEVLETRQLLTGGGGKYLRNHASNGDHSESTGGRSLHDQFFRDLNSEESVRVGRRCRQGKWINGQSSYRCDSGF